MRRMGNQSFSCSSCLVFMVIILIVNLTLGAYCFSYSLDTIAGTHVSPTMNTLGGLALGEITIPLAVICWIVNTSGVKHPWINKTK